MPLSPLQRDVLAALAPNRSPGSWVAGSTVLAPWLSRFPHDIDLHHLTEADMLSAMETDLRALAKMGFVAGAFRRHRNEIEIRFTKGTAEVEINWVREPAPPEGGTAPDPVFGTRASYTAVIRRKLEMYLDQLEPKHEKDLREVVAYGLDTGLPNDLRQRLAGLGLPMSCHHVHG